MSVTWPIVLQTDSMQARSFQHDTCPTSKLRGCFDIRDKSIQELRDKNVISTRHISRTLNIADLLTHCLCRSKFYKILNRAQNLRTYNAKGACVYKSVISLYRCKQVSAQGERSSY